MLRPFTIADLGALRTAQSQALYLNSQLLLTAGPRAALARAVLSPLAPFTGVFTYICTPNGSGALIGQVHHNSGSPAAFCTLLAPRTAINGAAAAELLEYMLKRVGERGAHALLVESDEDDPVLVALRQAGFTIYARQTIWRLERTPNPVGPTTAWRPTLLRDKLPIQLLRNSLMPGQVQQAESVEAKQLDGYVYYQDGELLAFAEVRRGRHGIWLQPFVRLDAEPLEELTGALIAKLRPRASRPVYVCLRSYQDWLGAPLEKLGGQPSPRQVAMIKRTVIPLKVEKAVRAGTQRAEPTLPIQTTGPARRHEPEWMTYDQTPNYR